MTTVATNAAFERGRKLVDAVLYEGYLLHPYRASARRHRIRWQSGVLVPQAVTEAGHGAPWSMQTECVVEGRHGTTVDTVVRFLQVRERRVEGRKTEGELFTSWDEGVEHEIHAPGLSLGELLGAPLEIPFEVGATSDEEHVHGGRIVRQAWPLSGLYRISAFPVDGLFRLRVEVENVTPRWEPGAERGEVVRHALVGTHVLIGVDGGQLISMFEPPAHAVAAVATCSNRGTWPVLVGEVGRGDAVLSSPITLYDYPNVAPECSDESGDPTEIDELLRQVRLMAGAFPQRGPNS